MKKLLKVVTIAILVVSIHSTVVSAAPTSEQTTPPSVYLDGKKLTFSTDPVIKNGSTLVPLRKIFEEQGAVVTWKNETRTVTAVKDDITINYSIGQKTATRNGKTMNIPVAGEIIGGSTMVPLRFVSESLGNSVGWEGKSRTIIISSSEKLQATVSRVLDGDTVEVTLDNGTVEKVRLIGIDTPESVHPDAEKNSAEGIAASEFTKEKLLGKSVSLELDVGERDQYGRLLAYLYTSDGLMYNAYLAVEGLANQMTYQPNVRWVDLFKVLVDDARSFDRGLWAFDGTDGLSVTGTKGKVVILKVDYAEEIVTVKNEDKVDVNMSGWRLVSVKGNQVFNFPDGFVLKAGATVLITSGTGAVDGTGQLKWTTANVHNNDEEDPAELYNAASEKVSDYQ